MLFRSSRRDIVDGINFLNRTALADVGDPEIATRIAQYELAYRMQSSVPELMDIGRESAATVEAYGATPGATSLANNCLLARRLVEKGVRFVQLFDPGWDHHSGVFGSPTLDIKKASMNLSISPAKTASALVLCRLVRWSFTDL